MSVWFNSILDGFRIYSDLAPAIFLPLGFVLSIKGHRSNPVRFLLLQLFFLYMTVVFALVFLPLPTPEQAAALTVKAQLIPFRFIAALVQDPCLTGIFGIPFNIAMTVPFGMFLAYVQKQDIRTVLLLSFLLSAFIEIGQLTGLFFYYEGSYRLFDVDDLIQNTIGGGLGYWVIAKMTRFLPDPNAFTFTFSQKRVGYAG